MADVNANIGVNIDASDALAQLKSLQRQIAQFHSAVAKSSDAAALAQRDLQKNFINGVNSIGAFSAELRTVKTTAESFTDSLQKNKFSMREYFRYSMGATKSFGRFFSSELDTVQKVAVENVKRLQTQYIKMGRDANGAMRAIAIMPTQLNMEDLGTKTQLAAQKQAIFNQLVKQGSTNLLNFGKNTQWAGRQLMVGFTLPLMTLGSVATRTFMDMETAAIKFRKVYGDLFTPAEETQAALDNIQELGLSFTKYGIAVSATVSLAAEAAAAGFQGLDLQRQTTEATRLQVLGQIDAQKALETTISLQNAFQMQSADLADSINFLNAVENQTVVSLDDITTAIPKAAPVVKQLGGDVKDLAFFMAAMKEGGINASEGANALKSGLASLINPTNKAREMMEGFGIDIDSIVNKNAGNVKATVIEFAKALDGLSNLNRQRAIEQLFGKFQLARLSTLFENVTKSGNQASRVLDLATASTEDLAAMANKELGMTADSAMNKFRASVEQLKVSLAPVGEIFLQVVTPFIDKIGNLLDKFNELSPTAKKAITKLVVIIGGIAPVLLMTIGLMANFIANGIKGIMLLRNGFLRLTGQSQILGEQTQYLTNEQLDAAAAAASLDQAHVRLKQTFTAEAGAVAALRKQYELALVAANRFAITNPGMMSFKGIKKFAKGIISVPGPKGAGDIIPAMLSPGEAVVPAEMAEKYAPLINGMIADNIPGFNGGLSYQGQSYSIPMSNRTTQSAVEKVFSRFSLDVTGITRALQILQERARALGTQFDQMNAEKLKQFMDEVGVVRNRPRGQSSSGGYVFAHAQAPGEDIRDSAEIERLVNLANSTEKGIGKYLNATLETMRAGEQAAEVLERARQEELIAQKELVKATTDADRKAAQAKILAAQEAQKLAQQIIDASQKARAYTLSNFGFVLPEGANKGEFSPAQLSEQFRGQNISRTMAPVYSEYARQLGMTLDEALNNPQIAAIMHQDINEFASRIAFEIGDATDGFVDDPTFYAAVERAEAGLTNAVTGILHNAIAEMKKTSTLVTFGGEANRGTTGQRTAFALGEKRIREDFGAAPVPSYRDVGTDTYIKRGEAISTSVVQGVAIGAGTASPSRKTIPIGEDIARGLEVGMANRQDDVARSGQNLSNAAISGTQSGRRRRVARRAQGAPPSLPPIGPMLGPNRPTRKDRTVGAVAGRARSMSASVGSKFAGKGRGAGFGLSGLLLALSFLPGKLGEIASKASMAAFALSGLAFLPGPLKLVAAGLAATYGIIKLVNIAREKERLAIEGIGKAANISAEQIKKLGDIYGFTPTTSPLATGAPTIAVSPTQRTAIEQTKTLMSEDKEFQNNVKTLKSATQEQADIIFRGMAIKLAGSGAPEEAIKNTIVALQEVAGRTDLKVDFKTLDLKTKEGQAALEKNAKDLTSAFAVEFEKGYTRIEQEYSTYEGTGLHVIENFSRQLQTSAATAANTFAASLDGISNAFANGIINGKQFNKSFNTLSDSIKNLPEPSALYLMDQLLKTLPGELAKSAANIKNVSDQLLILKAAALGIAVSAVQLQVLADNEGFSYGAKNVRDNLEKQIKERMEAVKKIMEEFDKGTGGGVVGDGENKFFDKELKMLNKKRDALKEINDEMKRQNDYQQKQMNLINQAAQAKISGNYLQAAMLGQESLGVASEYARESQELQMGKVIDITSAAKSAAEKRKRMNAADYKLRDNIRAGNYGAIAPMAKTPNLGINYPAGNNVYNFNLTANGIQDPKKFIDAGIEYAKLMANKNNKTNKVAK